MIAALAVALFVFAFLSPRRSRRLQRGVDRKLEEGKEATDQSATPADDLLQKPLDAAERATDASAEAGRKTRFRA